MFIWLWVSFCSIGFVDLLDPRNTDARSNNGIFKMSFVKNLKNYTKIVGDSLRIRCEVELIEVIDLSTVKNDSVISDEERDTLVKKFEWLKNDAPLIIERKRMKIKTRLKNKISQFTQLRISSLETLDTAFYTCRAINWKGDVIENHSVVKVEKRQEENQEELKTDESYYSYSDDYGDYDYDETSYATHDDGSELFSKSNAEIVFEGGKRPSSQNIFNGASHTGDRDDGICEVYRGQACAQHLQMSDSGVFIRESTNQEKLEREVTSIISAIKSSTQLSDGCSPFAIPAICLQFFSPCLQPSYRSRSSPRTIRELCREECELMEKRICRHEIILAKRLLMVQQKSFLPIPQCDRLPTIGSHDASHCISIGLLDKSDLLQTHNCFVGRGVDFRGATSSTAEGERCAPWDVNAGMNRGGGASSSSPELLGGHNFCRNPDGISDQPWCFVHQNAVKSSEGSLIRKPCGIKRCQNFTTLYLYLGVPVLLVFVILVGIFLGMCIMRRRLIKTVDSAVSGVGDPDNICCEIASSTKSSSHVGGNRMIAAPNTKHDTSFNNLVASGHSSVCMDNPLLNPLLPFEETSWHNSSWTQEGGHHIGSVSNSDTTSYNHHGTTANVRQLSLVNIRFHEELGEGAYGKVYCAQLVGVTGLLENNGELVAIKTLKGGASEKTRSDFKREAYLMAELSHINIVCLVGVAFSDTDPNCIIFEHMPNGDLHEFILSHSPMSADENYSPAEYYGITTGNQEEGGGGGANSSSIRSESPMTAHRTNGTTSSILSTSDMAFISIQVASGMNYLSSKRYVHRDLATRNCLVGDRLQIKISDFGLSRDMYSSDYYQMMESSSTSCLLPVRWMSPESVCYGTFSTHSDVWAFGVLLWELYSYGLQPYYGYPNHEVVDMIRQRQLLPCPEDCPSRIYAFMVECWNEIPTRRPTFQEIHYRLSHWEMMPSTGGAGPSKNTSGGSNSSTTGSIPYGGGGVRKGSGRGHHRKVSTSVDDLNDESTTTTTSERGGGGSDNLVNRWLQKSSNVGNSNSVHSEIQQQCMGQGRVGGGVNRKFGVGVCRPVLTDGYNSSTTSTNTTYDNNSHPLV